ncbi:methyl-accepting chemotaxis protein [Roseofilum capinflatum]|uniref:Methyl-accepting chemotaxis protein n=1 Tax=Roseofilum capinflatum BLCC-M114 TaxID=3022440 RepID=A0ABT7BB61_9CYAN|nr:methyl-accepting chemotaxis protein [Roseofilum capinflatum]MDJ1175761.1 methyl-accepting chemotaxis protein [Roseofilum capinflatum BLCC-M114]
MSFTYSNYKVPSQITWIVVIICILPFGFNLFGIDFGTTGQPFDLQDALNWENSEVVDAMHYALAGSFVHTILEWSACCAALLIVLLSFLNYSITGNPITPTLGIALFFAGVMDAFHTLASDRLIDAVADHHNLIPFTWAICRLFHALIMIGGVLILLVHPSINYSPTNPHNTKQFNLIFVISIVFGFIAYAIIYFSATSYNLPETMFPNSLITRPWDVIPLILFLLTGWVLYPMFYRKQPSIFADSLIISAIPNVATQVYMAFGSTTLFDNNFNIAHFLKIIAYLVPLTGLCLEYIQIYQTKTRYLSDDLKKSINLLKSLGTKVLDATQVTQIVRDSSNELKGMIDNQVIGTQEVVENTRKISKNADSLLIKIENFETTFNALQGSVDIVSSQLSKIDDDSRNVKRIVDKITGIATQTKMLSLNASIEASRVNTHGNGQEFTVIAREIGHLATEASMVAKTIQPIVQDMQSSVKYGVDQMKTFTQEYMEALIPEIELMRDHIKEQKEGANQISQGVNALNSDSEHTASYLKETFEQTNFALENLEQAVEDLQLEITRFSGAKED